jgi:hypothetical protein
MCLSAIFVNSEYSPPTYIFIQRFSPYTLFSFRYSPSARIFIVRVLPMRLGNENGQKELCIFQGTVSRAELGFF